MNARLQGNKIKRIRVENAIMREAAFEAVGTWCYPCIAKYGQKQAIPDHLVIHDAKKIDVLA
jgi:predicted MarR family transcription regulator